MNRRTLLSGISAVAVGGFAGCVADGSGGDDENTSDGGSETDVEQMPGDDVTSDTETGPSETPSGTDGGLTDSSLTVVDVGCGTQHDAADVRFEAENGTVVVTGTLWGSDLCKIPALADARFDAEADELTVTVTTTNRDPDGTPVCGECIAELDYRTTHQFAGSLPGSVTVVHDHGDDSSTVTTATPS